MSTSASGSLMRAMLVDLHGSRRRVGDVASDAAMRIHHLNCGTMRPPTERLLSGQGSFVGPGRLVAHCLAIEAPGGTVLVDTGFGLASIDDPSRLPGPNRHFVRPTPA